MSNAENSVGSASKELPAVIALHYTGSWPEKRFGSREKGEGRPCKIAAQAAAEAGRESRARSTKKAEGSQNPGRAAEVGEAFERFRKANPDPRGELEHLNPFTLLVAVALSAQATDAGVNKATRNLFPVADTPEKMLALGEEKLRDYIKTIGLYRNKAKNVIALRRS